MSLGPQGSGPGSSDQPSGSGIGDDTAVRRLEGEQRNIIQDVSRENGTASGLMAFPEAEDLVMHVRSPVASYWRGPVFARFVNGVWRPDPNARVGDDAGLARDRLLRYTQTYFLNQDQPGTPFVGYQALKVQAPQETQYQNSLGRGFSYRVVSAQPELVPERMRRDRPRSPIEEYYRLPSSMGWLRDLANDIIADADTGFDRSMRIADYLSRNGRYDQSAPSQVSSSATPEAFLLEGAEGSSIDFATATVLLARAANLPARLAVGYLPGERDPLSGAYAVRGKDAHAWAEILYRDHGWVPYDATPLPDLYASGRPQQGRLGGLKYLFESSVGDELLKGLVVTPARLVSGLRDAFASPGISALGAVVVASALMGLAWVGARVLLKGRRRTDKKWVYVRLSGGDREELLRTYARAQKLLRNRDVRPRRPGETLREYARAAVEKVREVEEDLTWLTEAALAAAYNPRPRWEPAGSSPTGSSMVQEAKARLASLKAVLN